MNINSRLERLEAQINQPPDYQLFSYLDDQDCYVNISSDPPALATYEQVRNTPAAALLLLAVNMDCDPPIDSQWVNFHTGDPLTLPLITWQQFVFACGALPD